MAIKELAQLYDEKFRPLNLDFESIATDWQMKKLPGGENVLNDHADADYDTSVFFSFKEFRLTQGWAPHFQIEEEESQRRSNLSKFVVDPDISILT
jgi:hypothetical protein